MFEEIEVCTCNKIFYELKKYAKQAIKQQKAYGHKNGKVRVYKCPSGDGFHLTTANSEKTRNIKENKLIRENK